MIRRHELTDQEWELLTSLIPRVATGRPRVEDRQVVNAMVYKLRTAISWRDLPERYGPWKTVHTRFRRYALDDVFTRALQQVQARADAAGDIDWLVQIDSADCQIYRRRNIVERCFNRLKGFRGIATRYEKTATSYEAAVNLASILLWARSV
ncbi:transposase [Streptomyces sp. NPDC057950]|uniref:transposase n=1 Tax=Streptomyces sp. NPDC057950 TaxID=3346288 RepID=UPI0036E329A7